MKKLLCSAIFLALAIIVPIPTMAGVDVSIGISLPPPIVFAAPPAVIVLPDTDYVYVVPDIDVELFFWGGWWWRLWEGRWYRSHYYNRGWGYYSHVPSFYFDVDPGWRGYYRDHDWHGHRWNYERIPDRRLQQNWRSWHNNRHWERQGRNWGVQGYQRPPQKQRQEIRHQRQEQYQQRPEVQRHQQQMREQQRQPRAQQPQRQMREQRQPQVQQPQRRQQQHPEPRGQERQGESQHQKPQGEPEGGDRDRR